MQYQSDESFQTTAIFLIASKPMAEIAGEEKQKKASTDVELVDSFKRFKETHLKIEMSHCDRTLYTHHTNQKGKSKISLAQNLH